MGFLSDIFDKTARGEDLGGRIFGKNIGSLAADPLDIFGGRARNTRSQIRDIQMGSAEESLAAQQEMLDQLNALYDPYRETAMGRLPAYLAMTTGGEANIPTSPMYDLETRRGVRGINRMMAAKGLSRSSARGAALADFLLQAGQNEAGRQYGRQLDTQRIGTNAIENLGGAGRQAGANVGQTYGNLGQMLNAAYQNYGQQRQQSMNQGANALYGLSQYMMER